MFLVWLADNLEHTAIVPMSNGLAISPDLQALTHNFTAGEKRGFRRQSSNDAAERKLLGNEARLTSAR